MRVILYINFQLPWDSIWILDLDKIVHVLGCVKYIYMRMYGVLLSKISLLLIFTNSKSVPVNHAHKANHSTRSKY